VCKYETRPLLTSENSAGVAKCLLSYVRELGLENYNYWSHKHVSSSRRASVVHTCDGELQGCLSLLFLLLVLRVAIT
jgi:hypothetical protein